MSHIIIRKEWLIYIPRIASARTYPLLRFTNADLRNSYDVAIASKGGLAGLPGWTLYAVIDGHAGAKVSAKTAETLVSSACNTTIFSSLRI